MARPLRLDHSGALWHITARGNERRDIVRDNVDREMFVSLLARCVARFGWRLLSWVLLAHTIAWNEIVARPAGGEAPAVSPETDFPPVEGVK